MTQRGIERVLNKPIFCSRIAVIYAMEQRQLRDLAAYMEVRESYN